MKLHLTHKLRTWLLAAAAFGVAVSAGQVVAAESISINFMGNGTSEATAQTVGDSETAGLISVSGANWNQFTGPTQATPQTLINNNGDTVDGVGLTFSSKNTWRAGDTGTGDAKILNGYLDDGNGISISVTGLDWMLYDVYIYSNTDSNANPGFLKKNVNGQDYTWSTTDGSAVIGDASWGNTSASRTEPALGTNTLNVTDLTGDLTIMSGSSSGYQGAARGCIAAIQIVDSTSDRMYSTVLTGGTTTAADAVWTKGDTTATLDSIAAADRILGTTGTGTINFADGTEIAALQASGGTTTVTGDDLGISLVYAKKDATLNLAGTLSDTTTLRVEGLGTVNITNDTSVGGLTGSNTLNIAENAHVHVTGEGKYSMSSVALAAGAKLSLAGSYDIWTAKKHIESVSGQGTLVFADKQTGWQPNGSAVDLQIADKNIEFSKGLVLNGWGYDTQKFTLMQGGNMTVKGDKLEVRRMHLLMKGGTLNAEQGVFIGHPEFSYSGYPGSVEMTSGTINTTTVYAAGKGSANAFSMEGGSLNVSGGAVFALADNSDYNNGSNYETNPGMKVTLSGGTITTMADGAVLVASGNAGSTALPMTIDAVTFDVQGSSLDLNHNFKQTATITHKGAGTMTVSGTVTILDLESLTEAADSVRSYSDGDNGFIGGKFVLVDNKTTGAGDVSFTGSVSYDNKTLETTKTADGIYVSAIGSVGNYYVNTGSVVYGDDDNGSADAATLILNGGSLTLSQGLAGNVGITAKASADITIRDGVALDKAGITKENGAAITIHGAGEYVAGSGMGGTVMGSDWTGAVSISGSFDGLNLNDYANTNSKVKLNGVSAWFAVGTGNVRMERDIILENKGTDVAMDINAMSGRDYVFANSVSGTGDLKISDNQNVADQNITFSGDISGWTGSLIQAAHVTKKVTFDGEATSIAADLVNDGTGMDVVIWNGEDVAVSGRIYSTGKDTSTGEVALTTRGEGTKTFSNTVSVGTATLGADNDKEGSVVFEKGVTVADTLTTYTDVTLKSTLNLDKDKAVTLKADGGKITMDNVEYKAGTGADGTIKRTSDGTGDFFIGSSDYEVSNMTVTAKAAKILSAKHTDVDFVNDTTSYSQLKNSASTFKSVTVSKGSVGVVEDTTVTGDVTVGGNGLFLAGSKTLTTGGGVTVNSGELTASAGSAVSKYTTASDELVGGNVTIASGAKLQLKGAGDDAFSVAGNLVINDGATITLTGINVSDEFTSAQVVKLATADSITYTFDASKVFAKANDASTAKSITVADGLTWEIKSMSLADYNALVGSPAARTAGTGGEVLALVVAQAPATLTSTTVTGVTVTGTNIQLTVADSLAGVTGGFNVKVGEDMWDAIVQGLDGNGGVYQNGTVTLTDGVNTLDWATLTAPVTLNGYAGTGTAGEYFVAFIPEPATGTLSVLALAALAARRRRKH